MTNLQVKKTMEKEYGISFRQIMQENPEDISYARLLGLSCSKCEGNITEPNLAFYNHDVEKVKCYNCQSNW